MPEAAYVINTKDRPEQAKNTAENLRLLKRPTDELIVVDASSQPYAKDIFAGIADIVIEEPDTGALHGTNKGILASTKPYIKAIADDDWMDPEGHWLAWETMEKHGIGAMQTGGRRWVPDIETDRPQYDCIHGDVQWGSAAISVTTYGATGVGSFFSRDAFALAGIYNTRFILADMEMMARAIFYGVKAKYCRLYTYEHPLTKDGTLRNQEKRDKISRELTMLRSWYGVDERALSDQSNRKHMTKEIAGYDGGFA